MTSEADSTPRRRPPTIELTASEVGTSGKDSSSSTDPVNGASDGAAEGPVLGQGARRSFWPPAGGRTAWAAFTVGAAIGTMVVIVVFAALWTVELLPPRGGTRGPAAAAEPAAVWTSEISARLDKISAALAAQRADSGPAERIAATEAEAKSLEDSIARLNLRLDEIAATASTALAHADAAAATANSLPSNAQSGIQSGDLNALSSRVGALEEAVKALSAELAERPARADDRAVRLTIAAQALRAAVERGAPYAAELAAMKTFAVEQGLLAPLEAFAADGVPNIAVLAHELSKLEPALQRATSVDRPQSSFLGRLEANAQKLVRISPIEAPAGDDSAAILARIKVVATRGDLAAAAAEVARLPEPTRSLAEPWLKKVEARSSAIAASRRIATGALGALAKPASQ